MNRGDKKDQLVVWWILNFIHQDDNEWLRKNIFYTRCTSHGKVCNVIIDGKNCENIVAENIVEKLQLKTEAHPHPYKLNWLNKGNTVKVNKHCLIQFSIGSNYKNEVLCDVVPTNVCHFLLGRPW